MESREDESNPIRVPGKSYNVLDSEGKPVHPVMNSVLITNRGGSYISELIKTFFIKYIIEEDNNENR